MQWKQELATVFRVMVVLALLVPSAFAQGVVLTWNASNPGDAPIAGYKVYRGGVLICTTSPSVLTCTDRAGLASGTTYSYTVSWFDKVGHESAQSSAINVTTLGGAIEVAGPSAALFASPYYTCARNFYVATTGNDGRTPRQAQNPATPWLTMQHANDSSALTGGDCVNVADGTYSAGHVKFTAGGTMSSASGYVVYRSSTLGGAKFVANSSSGGYFFEIATNYMMFDGFEIDCNNNTLVAAIVMGDHTKNKHHLWVTNTTVHDCGLSGMQLNDSDYIWVLHNLSYHNSSTSGFMGSGISLYQPRAVSPYTPTAMDLAWEPYHIIANYNISHNNNNAQGAFGNTNTDGNGIILDDWSNHFRSGGVLYTAPGLVVGNITYHNGGSGIRMVYGTPTGTLVANNTSYNNNWDTFNPGTWRPEIGAQQTYGVIWENNLAYAVPGAGILATNTPYATIQGNIPAGGGAPVAVTFTNNIGFGTGNTNYATVSWDLPNSFSCTANKCNSDPLWVNKAANNFALQAGSPAIAYGVSYTYGPAAPVDAGACVHTLGTCP